MLRRIASLSPLIRSSSRSSFLNEADCSQRIAEVFNAGILASENFGTFIKEKNPFISFVLGGPGSGKGTQCAKVVETFGFTHLSAGDLLREEISSNRENRAMILDTIKEGKIVPSEVTVKLIKKAIKSRENHKFLIDGFPRTEENRLAYERIIGVDPNVVLFFDCPEEEMVKRVLSRNQGRVDDNEYTIKKRLQVFWDLNLPVINYYSKRGLLRTINATGSEDQIYEQVRQIFYAYEVRSADAWPWKALLRIRNLLLPFTSFAVSGQCSFLGVRQYKVKAGYAALRGHHARVPWARMVWSGDVFPRHQVILWLALKNR